MSRVSIVCYQLEVSADHSSRGIIPNVCVCVRARACVSECDREASIIGVSLFYCAISFSAPPCRCNQILLFVFPISTPHG